MSLYQLFLQCITIEYQEVGQSVNYATRRQADALYIYFQGSKGGEDWKVNLDFPAKAYKRMDKPVWFAHRGFLKVWKIIEQVIMEIIRDKSIRRIIIVGYSHGAAIALLCHEYVWYHRPDIRDTVEGYGFACPRVIWGMQSAKIRLRWARFLVIRNLSDIVTYLPPMLFGYRHVGQMLQIGKCGKYGIIGAHQPDNILHELEEYENARMKKGPVEE